MRLIRCLHSPQQASFIPSLSGAPHHASRSHGARHWPYSRYEQHHQRHAKVVGETEIIMYQESTDISKLAHAAISMFRFVVGELQQSLHDENITPALLDLLLFIANQDASPTMTNIARHMRYSTAAATGAVDRLVKLGFLERSHATDDRRKICVYLTQKGREFLTNAQTLCGERLASIMDNPRNPQERSIQNMLLALATN